MKTILSLIETAGTGGAEQVFVDLATRLDPARWRVVPVVPGPGWISERLVDGGLIPVMLNDRVPLDPAYFARLVALARRERTSLIHGHLFGSAVRAALLSLLTGIPAIGTLHGIVDLSDRERFRAVKLALLRRGLDRLVFVSEPFRSAFLAAVPFPAALTAVIPNGVDASRFRGGNGAAFRRAVGIPDDAFLVGTVGNAHPAKGFDLLLKAAALLRARGIRVRLVVVGEMLGGEGERLIQMRRDLDLEPMVTFTGFRSDIRDALAAFDLYVLSSRSEGFSLAIVEAMAAARPVIATRCGGPEFILNDGETGLLVPVTAPAIADAVIRMRDDGLLRMALATAGLASAEARFGYQAQIDAHEQLFGDVLANRRPSMARA